MYFLTFFFNVFVFYGFYVFEQGRGRTFTSGSGRAEGKGEADSPLGRDPRIMTEPKADT